MKQRVETYCEVEFLNSFFDQLPQDSFLESVLHGNQYDQFRTFCRILFSDLDICVDSEEEIVKLSQTHPLFLKLLKSDISGGSRIIDFSNHFKNLKEETYVKKLNPSSAHLYNTQNKYYAANHALGFLTSIPSWNVLVEVLKTHLEFKLVKDKPSPENLLSWKILKKYSFWSNAAVIADPYLLKSHSGFIYNLYKLLEALLPDELEIPFHLSILTNYKDYKNGNRKYLRIKDFLNSLDKNYDIELGVYLNVDIHDRDILSNYYRVHSGHSFDYFDEEDRITKETTLYLSGLLAGNGSVYFQLRNSLKKAIIKAKTGFDHFGHDKNRLIHA